jgi:hypothetical protein
MIDVVGTASSLPGVVRPRKVYENPAHNLGRCSEKMRPILPVGGLDVHQMQVGLMHQCSGLERISRTLVPHIPAGNTTEVVIDQGRQTLQGRWVSTAPSPDEGGNLG